MVEKRYKRKIYLQDKPRDEAKKELLAAFQLPSKKEIIQTTDALGRSTAEPIFAHTSMPHYHASAMDGIAVLAEETYRAHEHEPLHLTLGEQFVYVDTGNAIPPKFNAVIMIENVNIIDDVTLEIIEPATPWQHIRPIGEDIVQEEMLFPQGHVLRPADLGVLLAAQMTILPVIKKPLVAIIPTGNELVTADSALSSGRIIEFNGTVFANFVRQWGGEPLLYVRAFELATGVDVIIDDTPDTVVVSCFDPVRRETARLALEKLVSDGRIHPGRIEEVVAKARKEVETAIIETGEQAAYEVGIAGLHPELVKLVGRMRWRTSYGQNILNHSKEVAWLAGMMAAELGLDVTLAKRGALLHDVGKVLTHEHEGTHVQLGVEVATKYGENPIVVNCIAAHHDDVPHESEVSVLVQAADSISGSRPGARREAFETYVKRLEGLEKIASSYRGVDRVFAIQAGREVRVVVTPEQVDDTRMTAMSEEIARRIESELQYPGQIKVVVIRESRAVDFAR